MSLKAKLVVVGGEVKTAEIKLRLPSTIGRGRGTTIMLPHPLVSRQHCELFETDGKLMVRDLGSLNGTFVNNERITESPLAAGELLTVGTVTFRAVYEDASDNGAPPNSKAAMKPQQRSGDPLSRTVRVGPAEPVELEDIDELSGELESETEGVSPQSPTFIAGPKDSSADKTDSFSEGSNPIVGPKVVNPAPLAPAPAAAAPPVKSGDETTFIPGNDDTESDAEADAGDEDDLNDFLKSLGK